MFQDMTRAVNQSIEPLRDLIMIQTRMLEQLTRQQLECNRACIESTLAQGRELQRCRSAKELLALQSAYANELESHLRETGERNLQVLAQARDNLEQLTQDSFDAFASRDEQGNIS
ncbi:MAG: phasin family protein [Marinobacterium sp.]|nr:phasin family protein [Marinobacterium sp.]